MSGGKGASGTGGDNGSHNGSFTETASAYSDATSEVSDMLSVGSAGDAHPGSVKRSVNSHQRRKKKSTMTKKERRAYRIIKRRKALMELQTRELREREKGIDKDALLTLFDPYALTWNGHSQKNDSEGDDYGAYSDDSGSISIYSLSEEGDYDEGRLTTTDGDGNNTALDGNSSNSNRASPTNVGKPVRKVAFAIDGDINTREGLTGTGSDKEASSGVDSDSSKNRRRKKSGKSDKKQVGKDSKLDSMGSDQAKRVARISPPDGVHRPSLFSHLDNSIPNDNTSARDSPNKTSLDMNLSTESFVRSTLMNADKEGNSGHLGSGRDAARVGTERARRYSASSVLGTEDTISNGIDGKQERRRVSMGSAIGERMRAREGLFPVTRNTIIPFANSTGDDNKDDDDEEEDVVERASTNDAAFAARQRFSPSARSKSGRTGRERSRTGGNSDRDTSTSASDSDSGKRDSPLRMTAVRDLNTMITMLKKEELHSKNK